MTDRPEQPDEPAPAAAEEDLGAAEPEPAAPASPEPAAAQDEAAAAAAEEEEEEEEAAAAAAADAPAEIPQAETDAPAEAPQAAGPAARKPFGLTRVLVALLLALLGFSLAVQVRSVATDPALAALSQEDLVRILANLDAHEQRLLDEIVTLEDAKRGLTTEEQSQHQALEEAERRADELGILAGTLPVEGPGLVVELAGPLSAVNASRLLDAVQELRGAGAEAMQIGGGNDLAVRVVASTYFVDAETGIEVDGRVLHSPYTITVIGDPQTLAPALSLPGGVAEAVRQANGTVNVTDDREVVQVDVVVRTPPVLRYARPAS